MRRAGRMRDPGRLRLFDLSMPTRGRRSCRTGIDAEVIDLRVLNPLNADPVIASVRNTGRLCVVDGGWRTAGIAGEIIARVCESIGSLKARPVRVTLPTRRPPPANHLRQSTTLNDRRYVGQYSW